MPETSFWVADSHVTRSIRDLQVHELSGARGQASFCFDTHAVFLLESQASGMLQVDGVDRPRIQYPTYTVFFLPKHSHAIAEPQSPMDITVIVIPERWFDRVLTMNTDLTDCNFEYFEADSQTVLAKALSLLKGIALETPRVALPPLIDALIISIVNRLLKTVCETKEPHKVELAASITERDIALVDAYIDQHISRAVRSEELADLLNMRPSQFSRSFKAVTDKTPMQYVLRRRVDMAKYYLATSGHSLVQIALTCGFASQSHFTTSFKEVTGITPSLYRARATNDFPPAWIISLSLAKALLAACGLHALTHLAA